MLQFIFGKPSSGKTYTILEKISDLTLKGEESVFIVPEQFTFDTEKAIIEKIGDKAALNVTVLSFSRLCDEVGNLAGGLSATVLEDSDKVIFMKRALHAIKDELKLWSNYVNSVSFAKTMLDTIGEFKINAISPDDLLNAASNSESEKLRLKLNDIAAIYKEYDILTFEKFIDPADRLSKLYDTLSDYNFFKNKTVFIDSFKGFTGQQYKIIERIISQANDIYIAFTNSPSNNREFNIFTNIRTTVERIKRIAISYNKKIGEPIILNDSKYISNGLKQLEILLSEEETVSSQNNDIFLCKASTIFDEANFVARTIRKLIRLSNYRFRDFVIIARNSDIYKEAIVSACRQNEIPLFYDNRVELSAFILAKAAQCAIDALDFSTKNILAFHKTGIGTIEIDDISIIENYTYLWNIDGKQWLDEWQLDPRGFVSSEDGENIDTEKLQYINDLRKRAIAPLISFKEKFKGNAKDMATAIIQLFDFCNAEEKLVNLSENFSDTINKDILKQSYEEYMKILNSLVVCFGEEKISTKEFFESLNLAVSLSNIGIIPQTLDQVVFGDADRIRTGHPKIAFILGANQGIFPINISNNGIFNISERMDLIKYGLEIADNYIYSTIDEEYLVYKNLCSPSEKLYISYSSNTITGEPLEPSQFVLKIKEAFNLDTIIEPCLLNSDNLPESISSAFAEYCRSKGFGREEKNLIKAVLKDFDANERIEFIEKITNQKQMYLSPDIAKKLYGKKIRMSASKFDTFNRCHFSYFCRYGLNTKKLQPADFDVMQRGTIVHFVLEKFISENADNLNSFTNQQLYELTDKYIDEYLNSVVGYRSVENAKLKFIVSRISRSLKEVLLHIKDELLQSGFKPLACELKIGEGSEFGDLIFNFDGGSISLNGSIDRVDEYNGYIRVIDYKTGSKAFKLPDILFGLNLQMLIYLYALIRGKGIDDNKAAAILYQPSKRDINNSGMAMNGLLQSDIELIKAMDKECNGKYVPKLSLNKDGSLSKRSTSFVEPEKFTEIFDHIERLMKNTGFSILNGEISISPIDGRESPACKYCDYSGVCGIENIAVEKVPDLNNEEVFEKMKEERNNGI